MNRRHAALLILGLALMFGVTETQFFGNHWTPSGIPELCADAFVILLACIGVAVMGTGKPQ